MADTYRAKLRRKGQLTLPGPVAKALRVDEDDEIEFSVTESGDVSIRGFTSIPTDQKWFWTPEWQTGEREASEQIAAGAYTFRGDSDEFLKHLDKLDAEADDKRDG